MQRIQQLILAILALISMSSAALADFPPPTIPQDLFATKPPTSQNLLSAGIHFGPFDIIFEKTTLADIVDAVGGGEISHQGDAGESIYYLCYTLTDAHVRGRIWIIASGEMGGPEHRADLIDARVDNSASPIADCPALSIKFGKVSFDRKISLGMQDTLAVKNLGPTFTKQKNWVHYEYQGTIPNACAPDAADIINYMSFQTTGGILRRIVAGQTTSC